jgi:regulator of RNase E activity RraA
MQLHRRRSDLERVWLGAAATLLVAGCLSRPARGQVYIWTPEQMTKYTAPWTGERFSDGRPKAPDELLNRVKGISVKDLDIAVKNLDLPRRGFQNQFVDTLENLHPGKKLVGRAVTLQLAPLRSDVGNVIQSDWTAKGNQRPIDHQTALDTLGPGDVIVIDAFGSIPVGGIIGDNLAYYIWKKTGTGFVIDGAIRDLDGISEWDMPGFFKDAVPPAIHGTMVIGINIPVRIGSTTVMPGDVVVGDAAGIVFLPPHLVKQAADAADAARRPAGKQ